jgi:hypothetical protein
MAVMIVLREVAQLWHAEEHAHANRKRNREGERHETAD